MSGLGSHGQLVFAPEAELDAELMRFNEQLHVLARETDKDFGTIVRQSGRILAVSFAIQTQPFKGKEGNFNSENPTYNGDADRKIGEYAVLRDIGRVYNTSEDMYGQLARETKNQKDGGDQAAKAFYLACVNGDFYGAKRILKAFKIFEGDAEVGNFDDGTWHRSRRNSRGRVSGRRPSLIVANPKKLFAYVKRVLRHVGWAKGGWAQCARDLGGARGIPQWVTRHQAGGGAIDNSGQINYPHVILRNWVSYINRVLTPGAIEEALRVQRGRMEARIQHVVEYNARKAGLVE